MFTLIIQEAKAIQCIGCMPLICGKNKGLVLCSGSKATKKFQKHICFLLFCLLYSLYLTSQQFKHTCFLCNCLPSGFGGICWVPTVCHARGWRCREKAVWTVGRNGCISWEWLDSADNGVVGEPEWTEVQEVVNGWRDEKGMEVRNSRERWGNHKEVRWSECKSVQIWEWWAVTDPGDILPHQGL